MNGKDLKQSGKRKMGRKQIQVQISRTEVWPEIKNIPLQWQQSAGLCGFLQQSSAPWAEWVKQSGYQFQPGGLQVRYTKE